MPLPVRSGKLPRMATGKPPPVPESSKAVFLSYASQDTEAAGRLAAALRAGGVEVWLDTTELRGGDVWDQKIQRQIKDCALFIPVISLTTQSRDEGYFRLEWRLAVERTRLLADDRSFLVPVVIDDIADASARVPEAFRHVQWTRLPLGETPPAFVERIKGLLGSGSVRVEPARRVGTSWSGPTPVTAQPISLKTTRKLSPLSIVLIAAVAPIAFLAWQQLKGTKPSVGTTTVTSTPPNATPVKAAVPAEQSVAVLPFVNESSDKEQEYFADGLTETMIDLLSKVPDLHVAARTSSFYFKGKSEKLPTIAKELNVANVLEGSVRKAAVRLRITARLVRADNGYQLWSETYDRDAKDIFKVQDEISAAVVTALKLKLAAPATVAGNRGTTNTEAYNQYLIGLHFSRTNTLVGYRRALAAYDKALALDPHYELARVASAFTSANIADETGDAAGLKQAIAEMEQSVVRAPDQAWSYRFRSIARTTWLWDYAGAKADAEKAIALDPTEPLYLQDYGVALSDLGQMHTAIEVTQKALELDPLATDAICNVGQYQLALRDWAGAEASFTRVLQITPGNDTALGTSTNPGMAALRLLEGRPEEALAFCQQITDERIKMPCVAQSEYSAGHRAKAEAALAELLKTGATNNTYAIAQTYAWRGETDKAFEWFDKGVARRDAGMASLLGDRQLDLLHKDPRWKVLLKKVNLPEMN
jgi:TolB-like protein/Tfp pilus assembly protein PilF